MASLVCRRTSALSRAFAKMGGHTAKRSLIDFAIGGAGERHTIMLQLNHRRNRFPAHVFDGILVAQPVRTFYGVVHVPAPVILAHIAQGRADAALCRHGMASGGENLSHASRFQPPLCQTQGGP